MLPISTSRNLALPPEFSPATNYLLYGHVFSHVQALAVFHQRLPRCLFPLNVDSTWAQRTLQHLFSPKFTGKEGTTFKFQHYGILPLCTCSYVCGSGG
jgi:hypothetical protein